MSPWFSRKFAKEQRIKFSLLVFLCVNFVGGCTSYSEDMLRMMASVKAGRYNEALVEVEQSRWAEDEESRLLYLMETGALLDKEKRFQESRRRLLEADRLIDQLYTVSIANVATSLIVSEDQTDYEGEDYEKVAVHTLLALSFIEEKNLDSARVEARRINTRLNQLNENYEEGSNRYQEDAFARYLAGMIYESRGEIDAAIVDYQAALRIYEKLYQVEYETPPPKQLVRALVRLLNIRKRMPMLSRVSRKYPTLAREVEANLKGSRATGEVAVVHEVGWIAHKQVGDFFFDTGQRMVRFSFPFIQPAFSNFGMTGVTPVGRAMQLAELTQDMNAIARKSLEDRRSRLLLKQGARLLVKANLTETAERKFGVLGGVAANVALVFLETADTRGWLGLPARYMVTRMQLSSGDQQLQISSDGKVVSQLAVSIKPGTLTLLRAQ